MVFHLNFLKVDRFSISNNTSDIRQYVDIILKFQWLKQTQSWHLTLPLRENVGSSGAVPGLFVPQFQHSLLKPSREAICPIFTISGKNLASDQTHNPDSLAEDHWDSKYLYTNMHLRHFCLKCKRFVKKKHEDEQSYIYFKLFYYSTYTCRFLPYRVTFSSRFTPRPLDWLTS